MRIHTNALVLLLLWTVMMIEYSHEKIWINAQSPPAAGFCNVIDFGAVGDGTTDDTQAFSKAWKATCGFKSNNNSTLIIPAGKTFLLKSVVFQGPCNSPTVNFQVLGNILAPTKMNFGDRGVNKLASWILFTKIDGLIVNGGGQIDGQGATWWSTCVKGRDCWRPAALNFNRCNNLQLSGLGITNPQDNHISIGMCTDSTISNLQLTAPQTSPNTDGIDIYGSTNINIRDSSIQTGDDCVAINTGCSNINITGVYCGPGHGISIGSLGINGGVGQVEQVHVSHCTFNGTQNGARIKTWQGGSGYARNISFQDITLIEAGNPILIDQYYCPSSFCAHQNSSVAVSEVSFIGFQGTSMSKAAIRLSCSMTVGCNNLVLDQINITASAGLGKDVFSTCINARGTSTPSNVPAAPCLLPPES